MKKEKENARAAGYLNRQQTERKPKKCFRCGSVDHLIAKCLKPPKDNKKQRKQVRLNERGNCTLQKEFDNCDDDKD